MKYAASLFAGLLCGVMLFILAFLVNPFVGEETLSPLAVSDTPLSALSYSMVIGDSILFSNDGESISNPHPKGVARLWEPAIEDTRLMVTRLTNERGLPAGIGIKISSPADATRLLHSELLVNSVWHLYLPERGTLAICQVEDYWAYVRDIVIPAWRSTGDSWRGSWRRNMTVGRGALGTARVVGLAGEFNGLQSEAIESLNARAYLLTQGPVSMTGTLSIALEDL